MVPLASLNSSPEINHTFTFASETLHRAASETMQYWLLGECYGRFVELLAVWGIVWSRE
jgi:hypothetical protein